MSDNFQTLVKRVVAASEAQTWNAAVNEWRVVSVEDDPAGTGVCVCGKTELVHLFTIVNERNGASLFPIGSKCVNLFERTDLNRQVTTLKDLLLLRKAIRERKDVELTSEFFSRALLEDLWEAGAFPETEYNGFDGTRDYEFLLDMFNKRNKDAITRKQSQKIWVLLHNVVFPFVLDDERLR